MSNQIVSHGVCLHSLSVVSIANFRAHFAAFWFQLSTEFSIRDDEYELFYDWCVTETLSKFAETRYGISVNNRYRHEVYDMAQEAGQFTAFLIRHFVDLAESNKFNLTGAVSVKTLVAGDFLTIATGHIPNV